MVDDFAERIGKEQGGTREIEGVLAFPADSAETFDGGRRVAALRAKGRCDGDEA